MIPLRLEITNFLSYRSSTTLDFHGLHLACISGANGAGKSSILDAITWALFGRSRSQSDDNVINRRAARDGKAAQVDLSFELEGMTYRVIRSKKPGRAMILEFQMATPDGDWKSLSGSGIRRTQVVIEALLKMNFDSFINASFFLQGKADEFTTKTANKRKEILADLLGVNEWDLYKEAAAERRKEAQDQLLLLDGRLHDTDEELSQAPVREAELADAREALARISEQLSLQEQLLQERRQVEAAIEQLRQATTTLAKTRDQARRSLSDLESTLSKRVEDRRKLQALLDQTQEIERGYQTWLEARATLEGWQKQADAYNQIQQQMRPHELQLEKQRSKLSQHKQELDNMARRVSSMAQRRNQLLETLRRDRDAVGQVSADLAGQALIEEALRAAESELRELQAARDLSAQELAQLETQADAVAARRSERGAVAANQTEAEASLKVVGAELELMADRSHRLSMARGEKDALLAEQASLREKMSHLDNRINSLSAQSGGQCPLCGQDLSDEHRQTVINELKSEGNEYGDRYRRNRAQIEALALEVADLEQKIADRNRLERELSAQQQRLATASARLDEIDRAVDAWTEDNQNRLSELKRSLADESKLSAQDQLVSELTAQVEAGSRFKAEKERLQVEITRAETQLAQIEETTLHWESGSDEDGAGSRAELVRITSQLESGQIAPSDQLALAELNEKALEIGYDPLAHREIREKFAEMDVLERRHQELVRAQAAVEPLDDNITDLRKRVTEQQAVLDETTRQFDESAGALEDLTAGTVDLAEVENRVIVLREQQIEAHRREETAQQRVAVLADLRVTRGHLDEERQQRTQLIRRLQLLERACGREGVQALLIERALPEIEDDANELLHRLSGGQMQISFDTQRKLKTSDRLAETLDIRIVDGAGERPYENYSGGEQFRVNFAIRLALSRILTRRAGARLQTLVIDEGFGSQDPVGRQRLIEAINTVQDDFERILVITHIDEMRDVFPNRIEVEKGPLGSTITVT